MARLGISSRRATLALAALLCRFHPASSAQDIRTALSLMATAAGEDRGRSQRKFVERDSTEAELQDLPEITARKVSLPEAASHRRGVAPRRAAGRGATAASPEDGAPQEVVQAHDYNPFWGPSAGSSADAEEEKIAATSHNTGDLPKPESAVGSINDAYWSGVNEALQHAALTTVPPSSLNQPPPPPDAEPWKKVFSATQDVSALDMPVTQVDWDTQPSLIHELAGQTGELRKMKVVPYDMELGARIMYGLSEKQPQTPPPTQADVDEEINTKCPLLLLGGTLSIQAPRCGDPLGQWVDKESGRTILRWEGNNKGGIQMTVDSAVTGNGSVDFASFEEAFTLNRYQFNLKNCAGAVRYYAEESVLKLNHMSPHARSTSLDHSVANSGEAFFYKYTIKRSDGTPLVETSLFRLDQGVVNLTMNKGEGIETEAFAVATRVGVWQRDEWRVCTNRIRSWTVEFPHLSEPLPPVTSVQDIRVAAAAVVTLMAFRDEETNQNGIQKVGREQLYWTVGKFVLCIVSIIAFTCVFWAALFKTECDKLLVKHCFRLEGAILPKRPSIRASPILHTTW